MLEGLIHYENENNVLKLPWNLGHILHERYALSRKTGSSVMNGTVRGKSTGVRRSKLFFPIKEEDK